MDAPNLSLDPCGAKYKSTPTRGMGKFPSRSVHQNSPLVKFLCDILLPTCCGWWFACAKAMLLGSESHVYYNASTTSAPMMRLIASRSSFHANFSGFIPEQSDDICKSI